VGQTRSSHCFLRFQNPSFDCGENFRVNCLRRAKSGRARVEALDSHPVRLLREPIVDIRGGLEMSNV
jgi:hypothetical protein